MNQRIEQLAEQAEKYADANFKGEPFWTQAYESKLAELIVKECAQICRNQPNVYALKADRDNCAIAIEQHFGVEE